MPPKILEDGNPGGTQVRVPQNATVFEHLGVIWRTMAIV